MWRIHCISAMLTVSQDGHRASNCDLWHLLCCHAAEVDLNSLEQCASHIHLLWGHLSLSLPLSHAHLSQLPSSLLYSFTFGQTLHHHHPKQRECLKEYVTLWVQASHPCRILPIPVQNQTVHTFSDFFLSFFWGFASFLQMPIFVIGGSSII